MLKTEKKIRELHQNTIDAFNQHQTMIMDEVSYKFPNGIDGKDKDLRKFVYREISRKLKVKISEGKLIELIKQNLK